MPCTYSMDHLVSSLVDSGLTGPEETEKLEGKGALPFVQTTSEDDGKKKKRSLLLVLFLALVSPPLPSPERALFLAVLPLGMSPE